MTGSITELLKELKPYVYVVGSYARGDQRLGSDLDLYVRIKDDYDIEAGEEETHIQDIISVMDKYKIPWDSDIVGQIHAVSRYTTFDICSYYLIDERSEPYPVKIYGVEMMAMKETGNKI